LELLEEATGLDYHLLAKIAGISSWIPSICVSLLEVSFLATAAVKSQEPKKTDTTAKSVKPSKKLMLRQETEMCRMSMAKVSVKPATAILQFQRHSNDFQLG
jgi:hypothetical protein